MRQVASKFVEQLAGDYHRLLDWLTRDLVYLRCVDYLVVHHEIGSTNQIESLCVELQHLAEVLAVDDLGARVPCPRGSQHVIV